jgi:hypothetical protein
MQAPSCTLIIDARERLVTRHEVEFATTPHEIKQITTADYVITAPGGAILAIIERKSLEDFAASLKDGRHLNRAKLEQLRQETGCRIIYIIEGPRPSSPDTLCGRIPYKCIESSIFHMIVRDGIGMIYTADTLDTARTLCRLVQSMNSLCADAPSGEVAIAVDAPIEQVLTAPAAQPELLTRAHHRAPIDTIRSMWACFPGISVTSADEYIRKWALSDIICGRVSREALVNLRLTSGRRASTKVIGGLTSVAKSVEVRLLACVPGVSAASATHMTNSIPLAHLLTFSVGALSIQSIGRRKLGEKVAEQILTLFNYRMELAPAAAVDDPETQ